MVPPLLAEKPTHFANNKQQCLLPVSFNVETHVEAYYLPIGKVQLEGSEVHSPFPHTSSHLPLALLSVKKQLLLFIIAKRYPLKF